MVLAADLEFVFGQLIDLGRHSSIGCAQLSPGGACVTGVQSIAGYSNDFGTIERIPFDCGRPVITATVPNARMDLQHEPFIDGWYH